MMSSPFNCLEPTNILLSKRHKSVNINKQTEQGNANINQNLVLKAWLPWQEVRVCPHENCTILLPDKF